MSLFTQVTQLAVDIKYVDQVSTPLEIINKVIAYAIIAAFILSVAYIFYGGFRFIFSGGDESKIKQATGTIRHAILGLLITVFAVVIVQVIGQLLGMDVIGEILNYEEIGRTVQSLLDRFSGSGGAESLGGTSSSSSVDYNFSSDF